MKKACPAPSHESLAIIFNKLGMQKIRIFFSFILIIQLLISCSASKELREERKSWNFRNWDQNFKERAFCLCQLKGFENKELERTLEENDNSYYDPLGIAIFDEALDGQIKKEVEWLRLDSINSVGRYPEDLKILLQKRAVVSHCFEFYKSKRLDSLSKQQKNYWNSIPNILDKVHEKLPTY